MPGLAQPPSTPKPKPKIPKTTDSISDSDHDGFISLTEFASFYRSSSEDGRASKLRDAFKLYNQDQNSLIFVSKLHLVLNSLVMKYSVKDCHQMI
ncbi:putative calcium-binding protein cml27 [Quercus suber]|uniref:Calcium-binding protein cml27 n=1 Tax=Quercus suber TaxID=58331 RepID=A0AAW0L6X6_QUESU